MTRNVVRAAAALGFLACAATLHAQDIVMAGRAHGATLPAAARAILAKDPTAFQFRRAMMSQLRHVKGARTQLGSNALAAGLSLSMGRQAGAVVSGTERVVVLPTMFANSTTEPWPTQTLQQKLFDGPYNPRTLTQLYLEMSRNQLVMTGTVYPWAHVASADTVYEGADNGFSGGGLWALLKQTLDIADATIDFRQYDDDGDGYVDLVAFVQPETGGECGRSKNLWSHRWVVEGAANQAGDTVVSRHGYQTNDGVYVSDYVLQPALNCGTHDPIDIGVFAHEFGHALGLPDLYATANPSPNAGIGEWGLMGAGNWNVPVSPAHMEAWSKMQLGWAPVQTLTTSQHVTLGPIETTGDIVKVPIAGTDEYFLLENRERLGSDDFLRGAGLLIWHVDSGVVDQKWASNTIENVTANKGLDLEEANGLDSLNYPNYRGGAGDVWPAGDANTFNSLSRPNSNAYAALTSGISVSNIAVSGTGQVSFDLTVGPTAPLALKWGDVDGDGSILASDANAIYDCLLGLSCPTSAGRARADVDGDGSLTARDALIVHSFALGIDVSRFRVGQTVPAASPAAVVDALPPKPASAAPNASANVVNAGGPTLVIEPSSR